jgi:hypothetical protein
MMNKDAYSGALVKREKNSTFFLITTDGIGRYLNTVLSEWNYHVSFNYSSRSDSCYIKSDIGFLEEQDMILVRISNHPIMGKNKSADFDVYAGYFRPGAICYVELIIKLADRLGQRVPERINMIRPGTDYYRQYKIELHERAAMVRARGYSPLGQRFYV